MSKKIFVADLDLGVGTYNRKLSEMESKTNAATSKMKTSFEKLSTAALSYLSFTVLSSAGKFFIDQFKQQEQAVKRLEVSLGKSTTTLVKYASQLQKTSTFADEQILDAMALISIYVKEKSMIEKLTKATMNLAVAKGMDLSSAAELVAKTVGTSTNALMRQGIELDKNVTGTERVNQVLERLGMFSGQSEAQVETLSGRMENLSNAFTDNAEALGEKLLPLVNTFLVKLNRILDLVGSDNFDKLITFMPQVGFAFQNDQITDKAFREKWNKTIKNSFMNIGGAGNPTMFLTNVAADMKNSRTELDDLINGKTSGNGEDNNSPGNKIKRMITGGAAGNFGASGLRNFAGGLPNPSANGLSGKGGGFNMSEVAVPFFDIDQIMQDAAYNFTSAFDDTINIAYQMKNIFGDTAGSFVDTLIEGAQTVSSILSAINSAVSILGFLGLKDGGSVVNNMGNVAYSRIPKFAGGTSFMVPPGFPNDSFPIMVQSGERVDVTPAHRAGSNKGIEGRLDALNANLVSMLRNSKGGSSSVNVFGKIEAGDIYLANKKGKRIMERNL